MTGVSVSRVEIFGNTFKNPILLAAGTAGYGRELAGTIDLEALGGLVTKAVSLEPRHGNPSPRVAEFEAGMLNSIGLANPGVDHVAQRELPWLIQFGKLPFFVNVVGFQEDEYARVIEKLEPVGGMVGYEINLSCPNTSAGGIEFGADQDAVARILGRCREATNRPLVAKLSPVLPDIAGAAEAAVAGGAAGISAVNTLPGVTYERGAARLGAGSGGVSGPALRPVGLLAVSRIRRRLPEVPIIGLGGISTVEHVEQYLHAGANLVAIGTAGLADPRLPERLARELSSPGG